MTLDGEHRHEAFVAHRSFVRRDGRSLLEAERPLRFAADTLNSDIGRPHDLFPRCSFNFRKRNRSTIDPACNKDD